MELLLEADRALLGYCLRDAFMACKHSVRDAATAFFAVGEVFPPSCPADTALNAMVLPLRCVVIEEFTNGAVVLPEL